MDDIQKPKPDRSKFAITSLIAGIFCLIWVSFLRRPFFWFLATILSYTHMTIFFPLLAFDWVILAASLIGFITGIKGFKSTKRNYAIIGIIFSIISFFFQSSLAALFWFTWQK